MINKTYVVYDESGKIQYTVNIPENQAPTVNALEVEGGDMLDINHYVDLETMTLKEKEAVNLSHSISGLLVTFSFLPIGTIIFVEGQVLTCDQDGAQIEFETPGSYRIEIDPPAKYTAEIMEITVG